MGEYKLQETTANYQRVSFFYWREKNDRNGNGRFRVFIIDSETNDVYETIFKCQEWEIAERVTKWIERA